MNDHGERAVIVPQFAEGATKIRLKKWLVAVGEAVREGDSLAEATTDKITIFIESPCSGTVSEFLAPDDSDVEVGQVIARVAPADTGGAT
jgi:2-oxoglutarate dehydrogenase E2 component (dihydrolipoamide succinyltransferase)